MALDINIQHLEYILEIYRCNSINKAAQNCYISQSHLSKILQKVERELGYPIIERSRSGLRFTKNGLYFIDSAEMIVSESKKIENIPNIIGDNRSMKIVSSPSGAIIQAFFNFRKPSPQSSLDQGDVFKECGLQETVRLVATHEIPLGIIVIFSRFADKFTDQACRANLSFDLISGGFPVYVLMSDKHPLAKKRVLKKEDLAQYPFVLDSSIDYDDTFAGILDIAKKPNSLIVYNRASRFDAVRSGYYLCHSSVLSFEDMKGLVKKKVENIDETLSVYALKEQKRAYTLRENDFLSFLKRELQSFL